MNAPEPTPAEAGSCGCSDVCSLPAEEMRDRVAMIRRDILSRVVRREPLSDGWSLEFEHDPALERTLLDLVTFERSCCSGLAWDLDRPADRVLRLRVRGLSPDSDFFRAMSPASKEPLRGRLARLAQAGALGGAVALLLCCVAPLAVAAVAGAAVAAPLALLDTPPVIVAAAALFTATAWLWLRRRASSTD